MNFSEKQIVRIISSGPLIFIPLIIIVTIFITVKIYNDSLQKALDSLKSELIHLEKKAIQVKVDNFADLIAYRKSTVQDDLKHRLKERVDNAQKTAEAIYQQYKNTKTPQEIKHIIQTVLRPSQWNNSESYIWIIDFDGVLQLGPKNMKALEGDSIIHLKDATGKEIIKEEIAISKSRGSGYLHDTFTRPDTNITEQFEQVAYVKSFGHYHWYFGTAEFLDTATQKIDNEILSSLTNVNCSTDNYLFIMDTDGTFLLHQATPFLVGTSIFDTNNTAVLNSFHKALKTLEINDNTYVAYTWKNPKSGELETKHTYLRKIENSNWIIGSGFYSSKITDMLKEQSAGMYENYYAKFKSLIYLSVIILIIGFVLSYSISKFLSNSYRRYQRKIKEKTRALKEFNEELEQKVKERTREIEIMAEELTVLATTDSLTKINNRYALMKLLESEINRASRYKQPLSVLMFDADNFKEVNDQHGHDVGDIVLADLARVVSGTLRESDIIGRYGGEEFLVIMPNTRLEEAKQSAERIRKSVEAHCFETIDTLTVSLGLVELQDGEDINTLFKRLDQLMYSAKDGGRNQLHF